ncbi:MAG: hypothetical protein WBA41_16600, partial [Rivularia sp. (in: cyanobacteria)]
EGDRGTKFVIVGWVEGHETQLGCWSGSLTEPTFFVGSVDHLIPCHNYKYVLKINHDNVQKWANLLNVDCEIAATNVKKFQILELGAL